MKCSLTLLGLSAVAILTACGGGRANNLSQIPASGGPVQMQVLFPPALGAQYYSDVQTYLVNNPSAPVAGANFAVEWADIDQGPGASLQYVWTSVDSKISPWKAAGKKVNLVLWAVSDSPTNTATPQYVWNNLGPSEITTCDGEQIPDYFDVVNFQTPYQAFIRAALEQYGSDPTIGYIRIGLGRGGETFPGRGINGTDPVCTAAFVGWGYTEQDWISYLTGMLQTASSNNLSKKQLMVGIVGVAAGGSGSNAIPDAVAKAAVADGIGFGSQGLQSNDIRSYPSCTSDWCSLFNRYVGQVPLELQTLGPSCPAGVGQCPNDPDQDATGSLVPLLPFAASHHTTSLEIYFRDWLIAYDPNYPGYSQYGANYATAIENAAAAK